MWEAGSPARFSSGCQDCSSEGSALQLRRRGAPVTGTRPALSPPRTCGLLLCRWRQEAVPEEEGVGGEEERRSGGRKAQLARPASSSNVTLCERQNPGAPEPTRARTHRRPRRLLAPGLPRKPALPPFLGRGGSASSELSPETTRKAKKDGRATSFLPCLPGLRRPIPRPEPRSLPPHPSGFHTDRARSRVCPHLESTFQHFGQRPGAPAPLGWLWRAFSKARSSFSRSSGEEPLKLWPPRVPRASLSPVSRPASRCQGNDLLLHRGESLMVLLSWPVCPRALRGWMQAAGPGRLSFPVTTRCLPLEHGN